MTSNTERLVQFHQAKQRRMLTDTPVWWFNLAVEKGSSDGWPISGDVLASFSKRPHSPRFPSPSFARVREGK